MRHVPEWFPGAGFKKKASEWAATLQEMAEGPHNFVKQQMASIPFSHAVVVDVDIVWQAAGTAKKSFTSSLLEDREVSAEEEFEIKWSAASLYSGTHHTVSLLPQPFHTCLSPRWR